MKKEIMMYALKILGAVIITMGLSYISASYGYNTRQAIESMQEGLQPMIQECYNAGVYRTNHNTYAIQQVCNINNDVMQMEIKKTLYINIEELVYWRVIGW